MRERLNARAGANFGCIVADVPWRFKTYAPPKNLATSRAVERHYPTMSLTAIANLPVAKVAARDCHLFLWTTGPFLPTAISLIEVWGFQYSAVAFVWAKLKSTHHTRVVYPDDWHVGLGYTTRHNAEFCLLGRRGSPKRQARDVRELIVAPVREHSRKPDEAFARIERYAAGPYLELFSREDRTGWTCLGDEVGKFNRRVQDERRVQHEKRPRSDEEGASQARESSGTKRVPLPERAADRRGHDVVSD